MHLITRRTVRGKRLALVAATAVLTTLTALGFQGTGSAAHAVAADPYTFKNVAIGGGGFVDGIVFNQSAANVAYARTDIGGAYRWNQTSSSWEPMLDFVGWNEWGLTGAASIATDAVDPNKVYVAAGTYTNSWDTNGVLLRSSDKGHTWARTTLPFKLGGNMPGRGMGERLNIDPNNDKVLYLAGPNGAGLWRSTDSGVTWAKVTSFPNLGSFAPSPNVGSDSPDAQSVGLLWVAFDKRTGSAGVTTKSIYVGVGDKSNPVYRSTDGGATWQPLAGAPTGYLPHKGIFDPVNGYLYISTSDTAGPNDGGKGDVWKFNAGTGAWTNISPVKSTDSADTWGYSGLTIDRQHPNTLMVATQIQWYPDVNFFRSTDGGATWTQVWTSADWPNRTFRYTMDISSEPWLTFGQATSLPTVSPKLGWWTESMEIDPFNSNRMMYGTGATIYGTTNLTSWDTGGKITIKPMVTGLEETSIGDLISPPSGAPLLSAMGDIGGFRHDDVTKVPAAMYENPHMYAVLAMDYAALKPNVIVRVGTVDTSAVPIPARLAYSTDGGSTWKPAATEPPGTGGPGKNGAAVAVGANGDRFVWSPDGGGVAYTTNNGTSWTSSSGIPQGAQVEADRVNPLKFYGWGNGNFYLSTNGGASFTQTASGLPTTDWGDLKAMPGHEGEVWLAGNTGPYGLWRSTDSGASFTKINAVQGATAVGFGKAAPGASKNAVFLTGELDNVWGIFRSDDDGASWLRINDDQHQWGRPDQTITGDPRIYGRFYLGTNGRGIIYGDRTGGPISTPTPTTTPTTTPTVTPTTTPATPTTPPTTAPPTTIPPTTTPPKTTPPNTPTTSGQPIQKSCTAVYQVVSSWQGGFQGQVDITAGSAPIAGWKVAWTFANGQVLTQSWSSTTSTSGATVTATNASYNGSLAAKGTTNFGFLANLTGSTNAVPAVTCTAS